MLTLHCPVDISWPKLRLLLCLCNSASKSTILLWIPNQTTEHLSLLLSLPRGIVHEDLGNTRCCALASNEELRAN